MHLNHFFLRHLVPALAQRIRGQQLLSAFSQDRDELILEFGEGVGVRFTIRAILKGDFTCLFFPDKFERARANSVDLFKTLIGLRIDDLNLYSNERAFRLLFETGDKLVFKMYGNRSNLIHFAPDGQVVAVFNRRLATDFSIVEEKLSRDIDQTYDHFLVSGGDYRKLFPTFGKEINAYLFNQLRGVDTPEEQWKVIASVLEQLNRGEFYLTKSSGQTVLSLLPIGEIKETFSDPIKAMNAFCLAYFRVGNLQAEKLQAVKRLAKRISQTENYLEAAYDKLTRIADVGKNEQYGNLLMANLHLVPPRAESIEVENFYTGGMTTIRLKADLSPAKNAEVYFRKAKNEKQEIEQLQENISVREAELEKMKDWVKAIEEQPTVKSLRAFLKENEVFRATGSVEEEALRFRKEVFMGYEIFIGKSAKNNDELTLKFASKHDLWLHAKDVPGSHVIIRAIPGRTVPSPVIERAAEMAAWHSKRRNDSLCPVSVTPRKYVRKSKGMPAGAVVVERESVVMVVPKA